MQNYTLKRLLGILTFLGYILSASAREWTITDPNLEVTFDDQSQVLIVKDKRCHRVWEQLPWSGALVVKNILQATNTLSLELGGTFSSIATIELTGKSELVFSIIANLKKATGGFSFPPAFKTPDKNHYLLETDGEGMLLPVDDTQYPLGNGRTYSCGGGLAMAWMGVTDAQFETGYMAILDTPFDAALVTKRVNGFITFQPVWMDSMGEFGYTRKVKYVFFDKGGYVAQCKKYREYIWSKNQVVSLKENQKKFPAIEKILGAVHIYVWDRAREVSFARDLKIAGIDKALILWDPNHTPYPEKGYDTQLKELGFATGAYELFTDGDPKDVITKTDDDMSPGFLRRKNYHGLFNQIATRKADGSFYSNQFGHYVCPEAVQKEITRRVEKELKLYPHETYFVDVYQANGLYECYSADHRLTRQQYAEAIVNNLKLLEEKYHTFVGGEWGADFAGSHGVYVHGMMTLQRTWFGSDINKKGTIFYYGNWRNNARPSQMLGMRVAPDSYLKFSINEYTRVPLYELVYHDAIFTSWRWEDGNHHNPEIWWKKDLFNILYGSAPLWCLDQDLWANYSVSFVESYKKICPWLRQICYDEMLSHRFVTSDHKVQETVYASGKRAVVNFSDTPYVFEGRTIKPKGFITAESH